MADSKEVSPYSPEYDLASGLIYPFRNADLTISESTLTTQQAIPFVFNQNPTLRSVAVERFVNKNRKKTNTLLTGINILKPLGKFNLEVIGYNPDWLSTSLHQFGNLKTKALFYKRSALSADQFEGISSENIELIRRNGGAKFSSSFILNTENIDREHIPNLAMQISPSGDEWFVGYPTLEDMSDGTNSYMHLTYSNFMPKQLLNLHLARRNNPPPDNASSSEGNIAILSEEDQRWKELANYLRELFWDNAFTQDVLLHHFTGPFIIPNSDIVRHSFVTQLLFLPTIES